LVMALLTMTPGIRSRTTPFTLEQPLEVDGGEEGGGTGGALGVGSGVGPCTADVAFGRVGLVVTSLLFTISTSKSLSRNGGTNLPLTQHWASAGPGHWSVMYAPPLTPQGIRLLSKQLPLAPFSGFVQSALRQHSTSLGSSGQAPTTVYPYRLSAARTVARGV
jgi:hypothetical protein